MQKRWKLQLAPEIPVEITREDDTWIVVAAGAVRARNANLAPALREIVGHLADEQALEQACRAIEAATLTAPPAATEPRRRRERRSSR